MKFKSLLATAVLGASAYAGTAQAAIESTGLPGADNLGGSELLLLVYDTSTQDSYTRDLGIAFNDINSASQYSFSTDALLGGMLGNANLAWTVIAADQNATGTTANAADYGQRLLATSTSGSEVVNLGSTSLNAQGAKVTSIVNGNNSIAPHNDGVVANNGASVTVGGGASAQSIIEASGGIAGSGSITGGVGDSLAFFLYSEVGNLSTNPFTGQSSLVTTGLSSELLGNWTLASNGTLSFTGSAVPVPAAVWLFGSALLGLVGVSRRKQS